MIESLVSEIFERIGHLWKIGGSLAAPSEEDVREVLDYAARVLYDRPIGTQIQTGGLTIEKTERGHDAYVFVGNYQ